MTETVSELLEALAEADNKVLSTGAVYNEAKSEYEAIKDRILEKMTDEGANRIGNEYYNVSRSENVVPHVVDWDAFGRYLLRHKALELLERRVSTKAWREAISTRRGGKLPGVEPFTKVGLNITKSKNSKGKNQ